MDKINRHYGSEIASGHMKVAKLLVIIRSMHTGALKRQKIPEVSFGDRSRKPPALVNVTSAGQLPGPPKTPSPVATAATQYKNTNQVRRLNRSSSRSSQGSQGSGWGQRGQQRRAKSGPATPKPQRPRGRDPTPRKISVSGNDYFDNAKDEKVPADYVCQGCGQVGNHLWRVCVVRRRANATLPPGQRVRTPERFGQMQRWQRGRMETRESNSQERRDRTPQRNSSVRKEMRSYDPGGKWNWRPGAGGTDRSSSASDSRNGRGRYTKPPARVCMMSADGGTEGVLDEMPEVVRQSEGTITRQQVTHHMPEALLLMDNCANANIMPSRTLRELQECGLQVTPAKSPYGSISGVGDYLGGTSSGQQGAIDRAVVCTISLYYKEDGENGPERGAIMRTADILFCVTNTEAKVCAVLGAPGLDELFVKPDANMADATARIVCHVDSPRTECPVVALRGSNRSMYLWGWNLPGNMTACRVLDPFVRIQRPCAPLPVCVDPGTPMEQTTEGQQSGSVLAVSANGGEARSVEPRHEAGAPELPEPPKVQHWLEGPFQEFKASIDHYLDTHPYDHTELEQALECPEPREARGLIESWETFERGMLIQHMIDEEVLACEHAMIHDLSLNVYDIMLRATWSRVMKDIVHELYQERHGCPF